MSFEWFADLRVSAKEDRHKRSFVVERVGSSLSRCVWRACEPRAEECERIERVSDW